MSWCPMRSKNASVFFSSSGVKRRTRCSLSLYLLHFGFRSMMPKSSASERHLKEPRPSGSLSPERCQPPAALNERGQRQLSQFCDWEICADLSNDKVRVDELLCTRGHWCPVGLINVLDQLPERVREVSLRFAAFSPMSIGSPLMSFALLSSSQSSASLSVAKLRRCRAPL